MADSLVLYVHIMGGRSSFDDDLPGFQCFENPIVADHHGLNVFLGLNSNDNNLGSLGHVCRMLCSGCTPFDGVSDGFSINVRNNHVVAILGKFGGAPLTDTSSSHDTDNIDGGILVGSVDGWVFELN